METSQPSLKNMTYRAERRTEPRRMPIATFTIIAVTTIVTSLQFFLPALLPALDRNPSALAAGQWWRLVTPRFVQAEIWPQYLLLAILAMVGPSVERRFGSLRWLALWLIADLTGEAASLAWQPQGAGASIGICGIIGAWLVMLLRRDPDTSQLVAVVVFWFITDLAATAVGGPLLGAVIAALVAV